MADVKEKELFIQMDKLADSLGHLSSTFLKLADYRMTLTKEENDDMFRRVTEKVCANCERREECLGEKQLLTYQRMYDILCAVEEYGAELNVELKRKLQKQCLLAPRFLRETLETYENAKQKLLWGNKLVQNREGYANQLDSLARTLRDTTRELDAGIFEDEHLEKKIKTYLRKSGVKMLSSVFYITPQGKYEIHLTIRASKGHVVPVKELAAEVGSIVGRVMMPGQGERPIVGDEYCTVTCVEGARYHTLQGVAKIGKDCDRRGVPGELHGGGASGRAAKRRVSGKNGSADHEYGAGHRKGGRAVLHYRRKPVRPVQWLLRACESRSVHNLYKKRRAGGERPVGNIANRRHTGH